MFILILTIFLSDTRGGATTTAIEFSTYNKCMEAADIHIHRLLIDKQKYTISNMEKVTYSCVEK